MTFSSIDKERMKLLENAKLDGVSAALCVDTGDSKITCRYNLLSGLVVCHYPCSVDIVCRGYRVASVTSYLATFTIRMYFM